jgi:membrane protease YdiL (CAAX protease family)
LRRGAYKNIKPAEKFALFLGIAMISFLVTAFFSAILAQLLFGNEISQPGIMDDWSRADVLRLHKILQVVSHIGIFIIPALTFTWLVSNSSKKYLSFNNAKGKLWALLPIIIVGLLGLNNLLYMVNRSIDFSFISADFQYNLEYNQALSDKKIDAFVGNTGLSFWVNLIVICILPAIGEELTFRGVLQRIGIDLTQSVYWGITFSALIFAIIHWQPFNFLPIFVLGWIFGYIVYLSGSIWITMVLHFLNNLMGLIALHLSKSQEIDLTLFNPIWSALLIIVSGIIVFKFFPKKEITHDEIVGISNFEENN